MPGFFPCPRTEKRPPDHPARRESFCLRRSCLLLLTGMPALVLAALFASALNPAKAWSDRVGWDAAAPATLAGVGGFDTAAATVRARWNEEWLFFEFLCRDEILVSPGNADGEDHFKLGDVVEVFVGREGRPSYVEAHATPAGRMAVYGFRGYRQPAPGPVGIEVRSGKIAGGWRALLSVPWASLGGKPDTGPWEFLAGRYDYDQPGGRPVLSSFPLQTGKPDFHDRARFARLELRR